jgi:hypothetical protein
VVRKKIEEGGVIITPRIKCCRSIAKMMPEVVLLLLLQAIFNLCIGLVIQASSRFYVKTSHFMPRAQGKVL